MLTAGEIMTSDIITVHPDTSIEEAITTVLAGEISGLPVTDEDGRLVGLITEFALLAVAYDHPRLGRLSQFPAAHEVLAECRPVYERFPGWSEEAAMWLAEKRDVTAIGIDTLSLDPGNSATFPVHVNFLATDRYGIENLANLAHVPPRGATIVVGLVPWELGSGGPARVFARW